MYLMKSNSFIFILCVISNFVTTSISTNDKCFDRWQIIDNLNIKVTLEWQIFPETNQLVIEFRTNLVTKGFWYAFGTSSTPDKPIVEHVYALQWQENDTEISWNIYPMTNSNMTIVTQNDSSAVTFQRLTSSGLLTVRSIFDLKSILTTKQCSYFVYMRGRFSDGKPLSPDEIRFNQTLCLTCQQFPFTSTDMSMTISSVHRSSAEERSLLVEDLTTPVSSQSSPSIYRKEITFFWFGRVINRLWSNDYYDFSSFLSQKLRLDLQNLFLVLINSNSSFSFICNRFEFYSLQSGSILFANNITLISNLSEDQTINIIEKLIKIVNNSKDDNLKFDQSAHYIIPANDIQQVDNLFQRLSRMIEIDHSKEGELDSAVHLLIGCIISISCLMISITSILCLYGYYKCRRRQFRHFTENQTLKFKPEFSSYTWLGQQPSISSSSPYLIQSTSI